MLGWDGVVISGDVVVSFSLFDFASLFISSYGVSLNKYFKKIKMKN
jgi:hypothetical protein